MVSDELSAQDDQPPDTGLQACVSFPVGGLHQPVFSTDTVPFRQKLARRRSPRLLISERSEAFRRRFFPRSTRQQWNDWHWQNRNRIKSLAELERIVELTPDERAAVMRHRGALPVGFTPYYASLLDPADPNQGLRKTVIPRLDEFVRTAG